MANKGIIYELALNKKIWDYGAMDPYFRGAGADSNAPDAYIKQRGKNYKVEVKLNMQVDFGQGSLDYVLNPRKSNQKGTWIISTRNTTASGVHMQRFLNELKPESVPKIVNRVWGPKGPPQRYMMKDSLQYFTEEHKDDDYKRFTNTFVDIPSDSITRHYNKKQTYYMHVGGHGLYYMGSDPAKLGVEEFKLSLQLRIRLKRGSSHPLYNYRFSTAIQAKPGSKPPVTNKSLDDISYLKALAATAL